MSKRFGKTILLFCLSLTCYADNLSGNGQWEAWDVGQATPQIDWCTAATAGCVVTTPSGTIKYYESTKGNLATPTDISFVGSAAFMNLSFSFNSAALGPGTDSVGFYVETQAGSIADMIPLFSTAEQNSNVLLAVSSGAKYGFYVENVQAEGTANETDAYYFMNASFNYSNKGSLAPNQHFAVYNSLGTDTYFIGVKDPALTSAASLFNSMLIMATYPACPPPPPPPQAPEPAGAALAVLGLGILALFAASGCLGRLSER
jgi:hypothetical protein